MTCLSFSSEMASSSLFLETMPSVGGIGSSMRGRHSSSWKASRIGLLLAGFVNSLMTLSPQYNFLRSLSYLGLVMGCWTGRQGE